MIVVADTSPLNYLVELELDWILDTIFGRVLVPEDVIRELSDAGSSGAVRRWAKDIPAWVDVRKHQLHVLPELDRLDDGERAAIELALEADADLLLIDERKARRIAEKLGLGVTGTLGILQSAHRSGLVDGEAAYRALCASTSFYHDDRLAALFLKSLERP